MSLPTSHGSSVPGPNFTIDSSARLVNNITRLCELWPINGFGSCSDVGRINKPYDDTVYTQSLVERGSAFAPMLTVSTNCGNLPNKL